MHFSISELGVNPRDLFVREPLQNRQISLPPHPSQSLVPPPITNTKPTINNQSPQPMEKSSNRNMIMNSLKTMWNDSIKENDDQSVKRLRM